MKAVVYKGSFNVAVEEAEDAGIQDPADVVIRARSTAICGSDPRTCTRAASVPVRAYPPTAEGAARGVKVCASQETRTFLHSRMPRRDSRDSDGA